MTAKNAPTAGSSRAFWAVVIAILVGGLPFLVHPGNSPGAPPDQYKWGIIMLLPFSIALGIFAGRKFYSMTGTPRRTLSDVAREIEQSRHDE
jgi:hypothetical protein